MMVRNILGGNKSEHYGNDDKYVPPFWARHPGLTVGGTLLGLATLNGSYFQVDETKDAVVLGFFGDIEKVIKKDDRGLLGTGVYLKRPFIDSVQYMDHRPKIYTVVPDFATTLDNKQVTLDYFVIIQEKDPLTFKMKTGANFDNARRLIDDTIYGVTKDNVGNMNFIDALTTSRGAIVPEVMSKVKPKAPELGIDVLGMDVVRVDLRDDMILSVYKDMVMKRAKQSIGYESAGQKEKTLIVSRAEQNATEMEMQGFLYKQTREGEADAEAAQLYDDVFRENRKALDFIYDMQKMREGLGSDSGNRSITLVLNPDSEFLKELKLG